MAVSSLAILGGRPIEKQRLSKPTPFGSEESKACISVLKKGLLSRAGNGEQTLMFEKEFAHFHGVSFAVATTSGTTALHAAICASDIMPDDEVIVPALTFISSASVVLEAGAKPVFADVDAASMCLDIKDVARKITKRTKAIIAVHLYGRPVEMREILQLARKHRLKVIEDCAQAPGVKYKGKLVGTMGDYGCFSFYQTKNMSTGEGGMVITNQVKKYKALKSIVNHGLIGESLESYDYDRLGYNCHPTELQAAIGIAQLKKLKSLNLQRVKNAEKYTALLSGSGITFQQSPIDGTHVYYALTGLLPGSLASSRDWFIEAVRAENVEINKIYPVPLHRTKLFDHKQEALPIAEDLCSRLFNFYTNPGISSRYIVSTCRAVRKVMDHMNAGL